MGRAQGSTVLRRAPNGPQVGDWCIVIFGPHTGCQGRLMNRIGDASSVGYDTFSQTYCLDPLPSIAAMGTRAILEVGVAGQVIVLPTAHLQVHHGKMPMSPATYQAAVPSFSVASLPLKDTSLDKGPQPYGVFVDYRILVIKKHQYKGCLGWLRRIASEDHADCEIDALTMRSQGMVRVPIRNIGVYW